MKKEECRMQNAEWAMKARDLSVLASGFWIRPWFVSFFLLLSAFCLGAAPHPSRGLWVGELVVNKVNEVTVGINAANFPVAPDPNVPTPTKSSANLRLILHVDGAGQVRLLKSVALVNKAQTNDPSGIVPVGNVPSNSVPAELTNADIALLTDATLYANFPGVAKRITSVAFDFSDSAKVGAAKATQTSAIAAANAAAAAAIAASPTAVTSVASNAIRSAAFAALPVNPLPAPDRVALTNVITAIVVAVLDEFNRARVDGSIATAEQIRIQQAASDTAALSVNDAVRAAGAITANEVPLTGILAAGEVVTGTTFLGADHPTNPFRHRQHPDHRFGYEITRVLLLEISQPPGSASFERGGYGVDRLTGVYKEEVLGLHKPLGPAQDIGLKVEGTFSLNRLSTVDTLNQ
jgi:hypothetical protein